MTITIDANNDAITISDAQGEATWKCARPHTQRQILSEIFNRLDVPGITLTYIDEDTRRSEEW